MTDPTVKCTSCSSKTADPRQKCRSCKEPVCLGCASYDEDGNLYCLDCIEDALLPNPGEPFA